MASTTNFFVLANRPGWLEWLRRELALVPGRGFTTFRLVLAVVLVTVISLALQVPFLYFSAFYVFFVTKENRVLTIQVSAIMILGSTIAIAICLFFYRYTFDYPELRIPVMAGLVFTGMFLSRTFRLGPLGFIVGFIAALVQTISESAPDTESLVRETLWLWVAIVYPIVLTAIINQVVVPAHPWDALVRAFTIRLAAAESALRRMLKTGSAGGQTDLMLVELVTRGSSTMSAILKFAESADPQLGSRHTALMATIAASDHLISATAALEFRDPIPISANDRLCAEALLAEITRLKNAIHQINPVLAPNQPASMAATLPQLREIQFAVRYFRDSLIIATPGGAVSQPKPPKPPWFITDAFTTPAYVRFALKVTLSAMICYVIYSGLDWPGITTAFITCCFIALENTGATMQKAWLRLIGCAIGGLAGFLALVLFIPHVDDIVSLVVLVAAVSAFFGWIAAGSDHISYAGLQGAFAFYLSVFQSFAPDIDFTIIRDRVVGIALGIIVSSVVFYYIWPENAIDGLRRTLARVLRKLSQLILIPEADASIEAEAKVIDQLRGELTRDLDRTLRLSELTRFENIKTRSTNEFSLSRLKCVTKATQAVCMITIALLGKIKLEEWRRLENRAQLAELNLRKTVAAQLRGEAALVEGGQLPEPLDVSSADAEWSRAVASDSQNDRLRLIRRLLEEMKEFT